MEDNHIEVIGVDHGWANCKTIGSVFISGVKEISTEPALYDNVLEYEGKYGSSESGYGTSKRIV